VGCVSSARVSLIWLVSLATSDHGTAKNSEAEPRKLLRDFQGRITARKRQGGSSITPCLDPFGINFLNLICPICFSEMIWGGDHDGEDCDGDEYIETNLSCSRCRTQVLVIWYGDTPSHLFEENQMKVFEANHIPKGWNSYFRHWKRAMRFSMLLLGTALVAIVHAFVPFFLTNTVSLSVNRLHRELWPTSE